MKVSVHQAVFDSPEAERVAQSAHLAALKELDVAWQAGKQVDEGDPNHPMYNGGIDPRYLFGRKAADHLALQKSA